MNIPKLIQSSKGDGSLARTVKGFLLLLVSLIVYVAQPFGFEVSQGELEKIVTVLVNIVNVGITFLGLIMTVYGAVMKIYNRNRPNKK